MPQVTTPTFPLIELEGASYDCGWALGEYWQSVLKLRAGRRGADTIPWWMTDEEPYRSLVDSYVPHLPDLYCGMARGALLKDHEVGSRMSQAMLEGGCTSFAVKPQATLNGKLICGQTKDVGSIRGKSFQMLLARLSDAPHFATVTCDDWIFGHGYVRDRCAIWRNSLDAKPYSKGLPYGVWGICALHCSTVQEVVELTKCHGVQVSGHCLITDAEGGVVGLEITEEGIEVIEGNDLYIHANASWRGAPPKQITRQTETSAGREIDLRSRLSSQMPFVTPEIVMGALSSHAGYPGSVCQHYSKDRLETATAIVAVPEEGRLLVTCGAPCRNLSVEYQL